MRMPKPSAEQLAALLQDAIRSAPGFGYREALSSEAVSWLGRAEALLDASGYLPALVAFRSARDRLGGLQHDRNDLLIPLHTAYHRIELLLPNASRGAFIPGGSEWNGFAALAQVIQPSCETQLLVDPYIDSSLFFDLAPLSGARRGIRALAVRQSSYHSALEAAARKWSASEQGQALLVEVRYAAARDLHDRLIIIDSSDVWLVSQSFKDIAKKSPASIQKADQELMHAKRDHYQRVWDEAQPLWADTA